MRNDYNIMKTVVFFSMNNKILKITSKLKDSICQVRTFSRLSRYYKNCFEEAIYEFDIENTHSSVDKIILKVNLSLEMRAYLNCETFKSNVKRNLLIDRKSNFLKGVDIIWKDNTLTYDEINLLYGTNISVRYIINIDESTLKYFKNPTHY